MSRDLSHPEIGSDAEAYAKAAALAAAASDMLWNAARYVRACGSSCSHDGRRVNYDLCVASDSVRVLAKALDAAARGEDPKTERENE